MKQIYSTKLPNSFKEFFKDGEQYYYNDESKNGYYILQFDMYRINCDKEHFENVTKLVDFWNSINATERYNYIKQYEEANGMKWDDGNSLSMQFKKDFCIALSKLYEFIQPLDTDRFREFVNSDNVIRNDTNIYTTQCTQYKRNFTLVELQNYFIKEYQN